MANRALAPLILAGWDGRERTRDALALAAVLARPLGARVTVVHVAPSATDSTDLSPAWKQAAEAVIERAPMELLDGVEAQTRVVVGNSPAEGLQSAAEEDKADLVVLGRTHRGPLGRVADHLLHGSSCAVAVAPVGYADSPRDALQTIGVAYDASPDARAALRDATDLARKAGAALRLISVTTSPGYEFVGPDLPYTLHTFGEIPGEHVQKELDAALAEVANDTTATGELRRGSPAKEIREACESGIDLLVLGSRGYGAVRRVLLGSVSARVIHSAPCPVLVVPQAARHHDAHPVAAAVAV